MTPSDLKWQCDELIQHLMKNNPDQTYDYIKTLTFTIVAENEIITW